MNIKQISLWIVCLVVSTIITYFLFEYTAVAIPFVEGGVFTVLSIIFMAITLAIPLDGWVGAGIHDETGWHLGFYDLMGPIGGKEPTPGPDYKPIVSRDKRKSA